MDLASTSTERNLISCVLRSRDSWLRAADLLTPEDFSASLNAALWNSISYLHERKSTVDPIVLVERLTPDQQKELDGVGGWGYIRDLQQLPADVNNVMLHAQELRNLTYRRRTHVAGETIQKVATSEPDIERMLSMAQIEVDKVHADRDEGVTLIGQDLAANVMSKLENPTLLPGLPTGFAYLDTAIQGFQPAELYVLGARKKTGKSTLLLNWARHLAVDLKMPTLWITTEHTLKLDQMRLLSMVSEVPFASINNGAIKEIPAHLSRVEDAVTRLESTPMFFKWLPNFSLQKIQRIARKHVRLDGVKAVFFDLIKPPQVYSSSNNKEWQELGELAYGLKEIAGEENIPVISAVQVNREGAQAQKLAMDVDSDYFAGSDRIAQALTVAMTLRRPFKDEIPNYSDESGRVLQVTDNRLGAANYKGLLQFEPHVLLLTELQRLG